MNIIILALHSSTYCILKVFMYRVLSTMMYLCLNWSAGKMVAEIVSMRASLCSFDHSYLNSRSPSSQAAAVRPSGQCTQRTPSWRTARTLAASLSKKSMSWNDRAGNCSCRRRKCVCLLALKIWLESAQVCSGRPPGVVQNFSKHSAAHSGSSVPKQWITIKSRRNTRGKQRRAATYTRPRPPWYSSLTDRFLGHAVCGHWYLAGEPHDPASLQDLCR